MCNTGVNVNIIKLIKYFMENRKYIAKLNGKIFINKPLHSGAPQCALLEPLLYSIYTYNILSTERRLQSWHNQTILYCLQDIFNAALQSYKKWYYQWKIKINTLRESIRESKILRH